MDERERKRYENLKKRGIGIKGRGIWKYRTQTNKQTGKQRETRQAERNTARRRQTNTERTGEKIDRTRFMQTYRQRKREMETLATQGRSGVSNGGLWG